MPSLPHDRDSLSNAFANLFGVGALVLLSTRILRYLPITYPQWFDHFLGDLLSLQIYGAIIQFLLFPLHGLLLSLLVLCWFFRRHWLFEKADETKGKRLKTVGWLYFLIWCEIFLHHYALDINPDLAWGQGFLLILWLGCLWKWRCLEWCWTSVWRAVLSLMALGTIVFSWLESTVDQGAWLVWMMMITVLWLWVHRKWHPREGLWMFVVLMPVAPMMAALTPLVFPTHGGTLLGQDYAYTFCEIPEKDVVYAAVTRCATLDPSCAQGSIAEHRISDLSQVTQREFLDSDFYGRLVHLTCMDDVVQVGMDSTVYHGETLRENAMQFSVDDPNDFEKVLTDGFAGTLLAYDAARKKVFYASHMSRRLYSYDRVSQQWDLTLAERLYDSEELRALASLRLENTSVHVGRNSLFVAEWIGGDEVFEMDLETFDIIRRYPTNNGGIHGFTVTEDRLYAVGIWGMEVFDLKTGSVVARRRLGIPGRTPTIDSEQHLVYVGTTIEGKVRVYDQQTLGYYGSLPIGTGTRNSFHSRYQRRFFAASQEGYFYWDAHKLATPFLTKKRNVY